MYPEILKTISGAEISTAAEWESFRRKEILSLFEEFVYGRRPLRCYEKPCFNLDAGYTHPYAHYIDCRKVITEVSGYSFPFRLFLPKDAQKPIFVFVYIMHCAQSDKFDVDGAAKISVLYFLKNSCIKYNTIYTGF